MRTAFVFTGQGSQFAGMGKDLADNYAVARDVFDAADDALGEPLSRLCFHGPDDQLSQTENTQPATLAMSIAAFRALGAAAPDCAAGHSLGEYTALTAAGSLEFADAIRLVRERARRMQLAVPAGVGGMVALRKTSLAEAAALVAQVDAGICEIANDNTQAQVVVSGHAEAMTAVEKLAGRNAVRLEVSVPFHCSLLEDAGVGFAKVLRATPMRDPAFPIYCNVDAAPVADAATEREALIRQFSGGVRWRESVERMLGDGVRRFIEFGPKPTLARMITQIANHLAIDGVVADAVCTAADVERLRAS